MSHMNKAAIVRGTDFEIEAYHVERKPSWLVVIHEKGDLPSYYPTHAIESVDRVADTAEETKPTGDGHNGDSSPPDRRPSDDGWYLAEES